MARKEYAKPFSIRPRSLEEDVRLRAVALIANHGNLSGFVLDAAIEKANQIITSLGSESVIAAFEAHQAAQREHLQSETALLRASLTPHTPSGEQQ